MEDPAIKLFGKKIILRGTTKTTTNPPAISSAAGDDPTITGGRKNLNSDDPISHSCLEGEKVNRAAAEKDQLKPNYSEIKPESDTPKTPSIDEETRTEESRETKQESSNKKCKNVKKPDKILPCPRCTSMDTKFCYYNNYNVNQPRHFCKSCQRYWTAGGTMRNMPVGAGRRKNKNPAAIKHYISSITQTVTVTSSDSIPKDVQIHRIPGWPYIQIPAICSPVTVYPSSYCNCVPIMPPSTPTVTDSILGKRSLQMKVKDSEDELNTGKRWILVPKTLRIDDPDEAARSSIWATLGIKNENFRAFQEKGKGEKKHRKGEEMESAMCPELQANPAAFSRSMCFQETS